MSVYAATDWHGCYWIWEQVQQILQPDDILYFLGDAADRGDDGWQIIKEIIIDPRVIYLKGNHEDFLTKAIGEIKPSSFSEDIYRWDSHLDIWFWNGGESTYDAIMKDESITPIEKTEIIHKLDSLPLYVIYRNKRGQNIVLSHAGCDSAEDADKIMASQFNKDKLLWDRTHWLFPDEWYGLEDEIVIHGHTPNELLIKKQEEESYYWEGIISPSYNGHGVYWYANGHKGCLDTGAVWNNEAVLLNLDTFEEILIKKGIDNNETVDVSR